MAEIQSSFLHCTIAAIPARFRSLNGHDGVPAQARTVGNRGVYESQGDADSQLPAQRRGMRAPPLYPSKRVALKGFDFGGADAVTGAGCARHTGQSGGAILIRSCSREPAW